MPPDKQTKGNPAKPLTPNLSSAFRQVKSPLTPKVFGSSNASPGIPAKRGLHTENATAAAKRTPDGQSTPTFTGNITPRSTARKSRIGTESPSTPDGAIRSPRPRSVAEKDHPQAVPSHGTLSAESQRLQSPLLKGIDYSLMSPLEIRRKLESSVQTAATTTPSQFFHADEVKSSVSHEADKRPPLRPKAATFYQGSEVASSRADLDPTSSLPRDVQQANGDKFFYASDLRSSRQLAPTPAPSRRSPSPSSMSSRFPSAELQRNGKPGPRSQSPLKETVYSSTSDSSKPALNTVVKSSTVPSPQQIFSIRRTSVSTVSSTVRSSGHRKSVSANSAQISPKTKSSTPDSTLIKKPVGLVSPGAVSTPHLTALTSQPVSPTVATPPVRGLGSSNSIISSLMLDTGDVVNSVSPVQSPTKTSSLAQPPAERIQKVNELAANARRERKVLDLEISNSSLLAINKTLEREMRKQSTELRRFRRLSRAGTFSIAAGSMRSMSGQSMLSTVTEPENGRGNLTDLDEVSDQEDDEEEDADDFDSSFDDDSSGLLSPTTQAEHDARHRAKDEKRLMLDLSKHHQLLIDSQKMSQSIRRCLGWTEDLIKEGNRALEYHVKVSDVELGGRVLSRDDEGEEETTQEQAEPRRGLLSPSTTIDMMEEAKLWANAMVKVDGSEEDPLEALQPD